VLAAPAEAVLSSQPFGRQSPRRRLLVLTLVLACAAAVLAQVCVARGSAPPLRGNHAVH
jgi:hypothetical protein